MPTLLPSVCDSALQAIGNTPLVRLHHVVPAESAEVLVKLEYFNPTGSYKDRMARRLAREEGLFVGTSRGLNVVGALQLARELGPGHTVAIVAVDTGLIFGRRLVRRLTVSVRMKLKDMFFSSIFS